MVETSRKFNQVEKILYLTIIVLLLQTLRNLNTIIYVGILFSCYFMLYASYFGIQKKNMGISNIKFKPIELYFLLSLLWVPIVSLFYMDASDFIISFPRYFVTIPFIVFIIIYKSYSFYFIRQVLRTLCIFMTLAALSIPFQVIFGPISFFAEPSLREGITRYSSLAGSLTAIGTLGAFALAILLFSEGFLFKKGEKILLVILLVLGMLMSLQKAALVNVFLCFFAYTFISDKIGFIKKMLIVLGFGFCIYGIYYIFNDSQFAIYIESLFSFTFSESSYGVERDLLTRLWDLPNTVIQYNDLNYFDLLIGIGFSGLGGIMGLDSPQAHNNYFDLIFSGGLFHFFMFMILIFRLPVKILFKKFKEVALNVFDRTYIVVILLYLINMIIGASTFYQPINAIFIFFILFTYDRANYLYYKFNITNK